VQPTLYSLDRIVASVWRVTSVSSHTTIVPVKAQRRANTLIKAR